MPLKYNVVARKVPAGEHAGETMYYAQIKSGNRVPFKNLCTRIARQSSATRGDVELILDGLITVLAECMDEGSIVEVGELGNFRMSAGCRGAETPEEFNAHLMKKGKVIFTPGEALRQAAKNVKFEKIHPTVVEKVVDCDQPHA